MAMTKPRAIGIDGGGTRTRACIVDGNGEPLATGEAGPALIDDASGPIDVVAVVTAVERAASAAGVELPLIAVCAGLAGAGREPERTAARAALLSRGVAVRALVVSDAEAAFYDAFAAGPGLLLIAGTGSMGWGRSAEGREARVGGWGAVLGDEGSAYDIALQALHAAVRAADGRGDETDLLQRFWEVLQLSTPSELIPWAAAAAKRDIAALTPIVCALREAGDPVASRIIAKALRELGRHVEVLLERLGPWTVPPHLAFTGGLIAPGGALRQAMVDAVAELSCIPLEEAVDAARGAARLALDRLGSDG
jgi:N-acetylglucosamine kinase-like BadF-type ATPase